MAILVRIEERVMLLLIRIKIGICVFAHVSGKEDYATNLLNKVNVLYMPLFEAKMCASVHMDIFGLIALYVIPFVSMNTLIVLPMKSVYLFLFYLHMDTHVYATDLKPVNHKNLF